MTGRRKEEPFLREAMRTAFITKKALNEIFVSQLVEKLIHIGAF